MTEDEQEMESWRYSNRAFFVLPLSSGRIAILCPNRSFYSMVNTWEEAMVSGPNAEHYQIVGTRYEQSKLFDALELDL